MKSKLTISKLKKRAWKVFSEYRRRVDADPAGYVQCCTCGQRLHFKETNCGHYIHGNTKPTYFEERNTHVQCPRCNLYLSGALDQYALYLEAKYGEGILQELDSLSKSKVGFKRGELEAIYDYYKEKLDELQTM